MPTAAKGATWLGRYPVALAEHIPDLEQRAAVHEFGSKMPRHKAEEAAYADYKRDQLVEATAHHLVGMRAAHAAGQLEQAKRHGVMYGLGLKALGHTDLLSPPDDVASKAAHTPSEVYRFKAHPGDAFALQSMDQPPEANLNKGGVYSWHLGGGDTGTMGDQPGRDPDKADALAESGFVGAVPMEEKFSPTRRGAPKNVFTEVQQPVGQHHGLGAQPAPLPEAGALAGALAVGHAVRWLHSLRAKKAAAPAAQVPAVAKAEAPIAVEDPTEARRYGRNGRTAAGKKNPYFNYDDYVPAKLKGSPNRPSGITVFGRGKEVIATLNHGFGDVRAFRRGDGGYSLSYDGLKHAHPIVAQYRPHVLRALADHLKSAHGAPYFLTGSDEPAN